MDQFPATRMARDLPKGEAIRDGDRVISYASFEEGVIDLAGRLQSYGLAAGDKVALWMQTSREYVTLIEAVFRIGAVVVPLNTREPPANLVDRYRDLKWRMLVVDDESILEASGLVGIHVREAFQRRFMTPQPVEVGLHRPATVIFSSGSTARSKAVLNTWGNHYYSALGAGHNISLQPGDRWLLSLPLYHVAGIAILFRCFLAGATVVLPDREQTLAKMIESERITHVSLVSTQLLRMLEEHADVSCLKSILLGGSAIPQLLLKQAYEKGLPIHTSYGMTETASQMTATPPAASLEMLATSGRPLPHREVKCSSDGEICVRGDTLFAGYIQEEKIQRPFDRDGWFRTGDLGHIDDDGCLRVLGRKDNMFISGGENVFPEEIERALESHPDVVRVLVIPVVDEEFGFRPVAIIESRRQMAEKETWDRHLEGKVAGFKRPIAYLSWKELPVEEGMKVSREKISRYVVARLMLD